jgi:hypothetical protein
VDVKSLRGLDLAGFSTRIDGERLKSPQTIADGVGTLAPLLQPGVSLR